MALEIATFISQLDSANPTGSDPKSDGDNHLRMIKTVLKTQFPAFGPAALAASNTQLDKLVSAVAVNAAAPAGSVSVSAAGVTTVTGLAGPVNGTIGATAPAAGAFTTVASSGTVNFGSGAVQTDASGNLGLGVTPNPLTPSNIRSLEVGGPSGSNLCLRNLVSQIIYNASQNASYQYVVSQTGYVGYADFNNNSLGGFTWGISSANQMAGTIATPVGKMTLDASGNLYPGTNGSQNIGLGGNRWATVYAATGSISTSDARVKTSVQPLTTAEIAASKALAAEIGTFKFLSAVAEKGTAARMHIGMTVQRCIEIMGQAGLDPFDYGFVCHDEWAEEIKHHPEVPEQPANDVRGAIPAIPARDEVTRTAGDGYSFRTDELLLFITRGFDSRLAALESA